MDIFDWEELTAEILNISDEEREDEDLLPLKFYEKFSIEFDDGYELAKHLIMHTVPIEGGLSKNKYHAFVSRKQRYMLMKVEADKAT